MDDIIAQSNQQEVTQFKNSIVRYLKKWPWVLLSIICALIIAYLKLITTPNQFNVHSTIEVRKSRTIENPNDLLFNSRLSGKLMGIADEATIINSYPLIKDAVKSLNFDVTYYKKEDFNSKEIYKDCPIVVEYDRNINPKDIPIGAKFEINIISQNEFTVKSESPIKGQKVDVASTFGKEIRLGKFSFVINKSEHFDQKVNFGQPVAVKFNSIENVAYSYRQLLKFDQSEPFSRILTLSLKTTNPQKSIDFINKLIEKYIEQNLLDKNEAAKNTVEFIDGQLAIISDSLNKKEINLEEFKSSEKMSDLSIEGKLLIDNYNAIETERARYEVMQQYYDYLQKNLESESDLSILITPSAFGIQDEIVNDLVKTLLELSLTEAKLKEEGNTKSPLFIQIQKRKKDLIKALQESIENLSKANKITLADINKRAEQLDYNAKRLPKTERRLINLSRLLKVNEKIYLFLMEKRSSAAISMSSNTPDCKVIEPAMLSPLWPIAPNKKMTYLIAIVLGLVLPVVVIVLIDFLDDTIKSKEELEAATRVPVLGLIPKGKSDDIHYIALEKPKSVMAESFRIIRTNLSFFQKNKKPFVIMLTSTVASEGKTFCAINLASILAASGKKTVLLGFDLRKPKIHDYLNIENQTGLSHYLSGRAPLDKILSSTKQENLFIVTSGDIPPNPAELLMSTRTNALLDELKESFDYIIMDTPPLGIVADSLILKEHVDLSLYVIRQGFSKREFVNRINEFSESTDAGKLSIMINDANKATKYGSGYYDLEKSRSIKDRFKGFRKT